MKIENNAGTEFLVLNVEGDSRNLNPYRINISEIRYIREYIDMGVANGLAIFVGNKMLHTKEDLKAHIGVTKFENGTNLKIGDSEFFCVKGSGLTEKEYTFHLINTKKILYVRSFVTDNKVKSEENDKFAIITVDERIIQIDKF
jgi:hypothetical protein